MKQINAKIHYRLRHKRGIFRINCWKEEDYLFDIRLYAGKKSQYNKNKFINTLLYLN